MKNLLTILVIFIGVLHLNAQNRALSFDGVNDFVQTTYQGVTGTANRTFEAWINVSNTAPNNTLCILDYGLNAVGSRNTFNVNANRGIGYISGGTNTNIGTGASLITAGQWTHVAFVLNNGTGYLYVNGIQAGTGNLSGVNTPTTGANLRIGQRVSGGSIPFGGLIDEVRIWSTALTASQILANMNGEFCAPPNNLEAYYKFNHGSPSGVNSGVTTLTDYSGNNNNGTLNNFALSGASSNWVLGSSTLAPSNTIVGGTDTITACVPYLLPSGFSINSTGIYNDTVTSSFGCDSSYAINFTALANPTDSFAVTNCDGYYGPSGNFYNKSGKYVDVLANSFGCDSLITIDLTINSSKLDVQTFSSCKSYLSPTGNTYTASGTYFDTLSTYTGCDSVVVSNLTITSDIVANISTQACDSFKTYKGSLVTTSSIFSDTVFTGTGCDSIFNYNIQIGYANGANASGIGCFSSFTSDLGNTYNLSGNYTEITTNKQGCDSVISLKVTIGSNKMVQVSDTVCRKRVSPSGKFIWNSGGWHYDTIPTNLGCDSSIQMFLVIEDIDTTVTFINGSLRAKEAGVDYKWLDCNTGNIVVGENARTFKPTEDGSYASIVSNGICTDTSSCKTVLPSSLENTLNIKDQIEVFPNPTQGKVSIVGVSGPTKLKVLNLQGQLVFESLLFGDKVNIELNPLPQGVYQFYFESSNGVAVTKLIAQ